MGRKILALCVTAFLMISFAVSVSAESFDPLKTGSLTITLVERTEKTPIVGAELSIHYIATVGINADGELTYRYTDEFAGIGIDIDDPDLVVKLDAYLSQNEMSVAKLRTNKNGTVVLEQLPLGMYFVRQTGLVDGFAPCTPFLVMVPMDTGDGYVYKVNASPKTEVAKLTDITIKKVWNTDAATEVADSVTVQLLHNGVVVQTAILNEANNWHVTYTDLPELDGYSVVELNVPQDFTATYTKNAYVFTVTNTSTLAQTGQLIWPIPVLALSGMLLIALGFVLLQKKGNANG